MTCAALLALGIVALAGCNNESGKMGGEAEPSASTESEASEASSAGAGQANAQKVDTLTGVAIGGAHSSIELEDAQGREHEFSYPDINPSNADTWEEGDTMVVTYVHSDDPEIGDSVLSIKQKNPAKSDRY